MSLEQTQGVSPKEEGPCQIQLKTCLAIFFPEIRLTCCQGPVGARTFPRRSGMSLRTPPPRPPFPRETGSQRRASAGTRRPAAQSRPAYCSGALTSRGAPERHFRQRLFAERPGAFGRSTQEAEVREEAWTVGT